MSDLFASVRGSRPRPWPWEPLAEVLARYGEPSAEEGSRRFGCGRSTVGRAIVNGLTDRQADHWAVALGRHPSTVWDRWDEAGLTVLDDLHVNGGGWRHAWEWEEAQQPTRLEPRAETVREVAEAA